MCKLLKYKNHLASLAFHISMVKNSFKQCIIELGTRYMSPF